MSLHLRSYAFSAAFHVWTAAVMLLTFPSLLLPGWKGAAQVARLWIGGTRWLLRALCGIEMEIRGGERLPPGGAIIASKHQSAWETGFFHLLLPFPVYVLKKELLRIPLFGAYLKKSGMIAVDRDAGLRALKGMLADGKRALGQGRSIVIFPEGTRMKPGEKGEYRTGVAALYTGLNVPVVPVALNSGLYWPRHSALKHPGTVLLEFLPPIPPGLKREEFMARLEAAVEDGTARLLAEGVSSPSPASGRGDKLLL